MIWLLATALALGTWAPATTTATEVSDQEAERLKALLRDVGREDAWDTFQDNIALLAWGFSNQSSMPTPPGGYFGKISSVHLQPRAIVFDDFLSSDECDFLRTFAYAKLAPAMVVQATDNWYDTQTQVRNNEQYWTNAREEKAVPVLRHINKRIQRTARVPDECAEALQIGRYNSSTKYEQHLDSDPDHGVARPVTLITYLNDPEEGGDTLFPLGRSDCGSKWRTDPKTGEKVYGAALCCADPDGDAPTTLRVQAKKGRAVLFMNHHPDGEPDRDSLHIGCPVVKGEKWIAQRWLRYEPYDRVAYHIHGFDHRFDGLPVSAEDVEAEGAGEPHLRMISNEHPRLYLHRRFLAEEEVASLAAFVAPRLATDGSAAGTEQAAFSPQDIDKEPLLWDMTNKVRFFARLHGARNATKAPLAVLQVQKLNSGASAELKLDSSPSANQPVTVSVVLSAPVQGGETIFTKSAKTRSKQTRPCTGPVGKCCDAKAGTMVAPRAGDALLLFSHMMDGQVDQGAEHGTCPVGDGESLLVATWHFRYNLRPTPGKKDESGQAPPAGVAVDFANLGTSTVHVFWVETVPGRPKNGGKEVPMGEVEGGASHKLNSFAGHMFRIRDVSRAKVLKEYTVGKASYQRVDIEDSPNEL